MKEKDRQITRRDAQIRLIYEESYFQLVELEKKILKSKRLSDLEISDIRLIHNSIREVVGGLRLMVGKK